jgi:hypothetical protein
MHYFILTIQVIIDDVLNLTIRIGIKSDTNDYKLSLAKHTAENYFRKMYPTNKMSSTLFTVPELVSKEEFIAESHDFIEVS